MQQHTNKITPEIRDSQSKPLYDEEFFPLRDDETRNELAEINEQRLSRPFLKRFLTMPGRKH